MRKILTTTLAVAVSVMLITGCGGSGEVVDTQTPEAEQQQSDAGSTAKASKPKVQPVEQPIRKANGGEVTAAKGTAQTISATAQAKLSDLMRVNFAFDKAQITPSAADTLKKNAVILKALPGVKVTVEGHCDERGTIEYNLALGERRANAVKRFLADTGVDPNRLDTVSMGEEYPLVSGSGEAAWAKNRRAEFKASK